MRIILRTCQGTSHCRLWMAVVFLSLSCLLAGCETAQAPTVPKQADKIVSLSPNSTEILFAIGAGDKVIGRTAYCLYPPEVKDLPNVGTTPSGVDIEKVLSLQPDVAIMLGDDPITSAKLNAGDVPVLHIYSDSLQGVKASILELGKLTNCQDGAESLLQEMETEFSQAHDMLQNLSVSELQVLLVVSRTPGTLQNMFVAGPQSPMGEMLQILGFQNAMKETSKAWQEVSKEDVIRMDPDIILDFMTLFENEPDKARDAVNDWVPLYSLQALRNKRIKVMTDQIFVIMGPRLSKAAVKLATEIRTMLESNE